MVWFEHLQEAHLAVAVGGFVLELPPSPGSGTLEPPWDRVLLLRAAAPIAGALHRKGNLDFWPGVW